MNGLGFGSASATGFESGDWGFVIGDSQQQVRVALAHGPEQKGYLDAHVCSPRALRDAAFANPQSRLPNLRRMTTGTFAIPNFYIALPST